MFLTSIFAPVFNALFIFLLLPDFSFSSFQAQANAEEKEAQFFLGCFLIRVGVYRLLYIMLSIVFTKFC